MKTFALEALLVVVALLVVTSVLSAQIATSVPVDFQVAAHQVIALGKDAGSAMIVVGRDGRVRTLSLAGDAGGQLLGEMTLADPERTLLTFADILGKGRPQLVALSPKGTWLHEIDAHGVVTAAKRPALRRARFTLRVGEPTLADIAQDVNGDGRPDLVVPSIESCQLYLNTGDAGDGKAPLALTTELALDSDVDTSTSGTALSDTLESLYTIPRLRTMDVNGDGRKDIITSDSKHRGFHLQREDGTIPKDADVTVDLSIFRDTSPETGIRPGRTLAGRDEAQLQTRDLDGDGIPDYVIGHRRKVWVFHGTKAGPQFTEPTTILRSADDVTVLLLPRLDDDAFPDLLILRVQIPTAATLVFGMLGEWSVEVAASGYTSKDGRGFETKPRYRSELVFRLPALAKILKNPDAIIRRFEDVGKSFRPVTEGDFDGNGTIDAALITKDRDAVEVWWRKENADGIVDSDAMIRKLLFDDSDRAWDIDRMLEWLSAYADDQATQRTGNRKADARLALRAKETHDLIDLQAGDLDHDGKVELVATYRVLTSPANFVIDRIIVPR